MATNGLASLHSHNNHLERSRSISQASEDSQTAQEFINSQLQLEADAREALPYQFDTCTRPLGPLRQILFSCLTCNPPPTSPNDPYTPAGVCYSCSISCHGEHTLVELFNKRNFVCDCGTTRLPSTSSCTLRLNEVTGRKGGVVGEEPAKGNRYNQNFANRFCGCGEVYDAHQERGTMFQCLGLGTVEDGGCGEDWWHPECVVGLPRNWYQKSATNGGVKAEKDAGPVGDTAELGPSPTEDAGTERNGTAVAPDAPPAEHQDGAGGAVVDDDPPLPPGFPKEDDFESFICYKCTEAFPWIKRYAGAPGFLPPVLFHPKASADERTRDIKSQTTEAPKESAAPTSEPPSRKRKASDANEDDASSALLKRHRSTSNPPDRSTNHQDAQTSTADTSCHYVTLPPAPSSPLSLFLKEDFRDHICRCASCFPMLSAHPQLLEEEDMYEPPISEAGDGAARGGSVGTGSLLERGEAALSTMDRVRAIEGVTAYNHIKDKVKAFLQPFAESGQAVSAEDIKAYFAKLRGDDEATRLGAAEAGREDGDQGGNGDGRREQSGY